MDHSESECRNGHHRHSLSPSKHDGGITNEDSGAESLSPRHMSAPETLIISPSSSSIGSPSQLNNSASDRDAPINPFRMEFDDDRDERDSPLYNNAADDKQSTHNNLSRAALSPNTNDTSEGPEQNSDHAMIGLHRIPSLSLSTYSGYDTEEDEDGVLKRFHDQAKNSLRMNLSLRSDDDDDSVYSAVNTSADVNEETSRSSSSHGGKATRKKKKRPADRIKSAIHGMRKAHEDAQRLRSTRQFLAMSEGNRSAHSFTEAICLSPWCDFSYGRGMAVMLSVLFVLVTVTFALIKLEHLAGGIWTFILGITVILVRRFWVPIYWLVWGQFVEKRRRRNMQRYDTLNGERERTASVEMAVQNFEMQHHDESEVEFTDEVAEYGEVTNNDSQSLGELA